MLQSLQRQVDAAERSQEAAEKSQEALSSQAKLQTVATPAEEAKHEYIAQVAALEAEVVDSQTKLQAAVDANLRVESESELNKRIAALEAPSSAGSLEATSTTEEAAAK